MRARILSSLFLLTMAIACQAATTYKNPIISEDAPDPSIIKGDDGYYYLFSTAEHVYRSADMVKWRYLRQVFDGGKRPTFVEGVDVYWAPCVTRQDGRYVLYFALSKWGGGATASIGVATADKPEGPYSIVGEEGKLFTSAEVGVENSIDPNYIEDNGHKYLVWGSWNGIWLIELTADGLAVKDIRRKTQIAGTRFEAPYIYKRGRFYYLFCSIGACCEGERSTYETVVGRATSLKGPYYNKQGQKLMDNDYSLFLTSNTPCIAPGHNSRIIEDETGRTWMTYHGYLRSDPDRGRIVWLDEVKWKNNWPFIDGTGASAEALEAPVVAPFSHDVDELHAEWGVEAGTLVPADLSGSGKPDLIVAGQRTQKDGQAMPWSTVLRQDSDGTWSATTSGLPTGGQPSVVPADLDCDGRLELVVLSQPHETCNPDGTNNGIYCLQDDGTLQRQGTSLPGLTASAVADVNRDGLPDIIAVGPAGRNAVLYQEPSSPGSSFSFQEKPFASTGTTYTQVFAADFNNDGYPDIFACSATTAELFLHQPATDTFLPTQWTATCPVPTDGGIAFADVNYDSTMDIICVGGEAVLCLNDGTGHFAPSPTSALAMDYQNGNASASAANLFDWNGDENADFIYQGASPSLGVATGAIWTSTRTGTFAHKRRFGAGIQAATTFIDWNGDGAPDLITTGTMDDGHLFPHTSGCLMAVTLNPYSASRTLQPLTQLESSVEGHQVRLTWQHGSMNQTYELYVRDDHGRLYGNVRSHVEGPFQGRRKVLAQGNCGLATHAVLTLPDGRYTWGVQRINQRLEASPFATAEFTIGATPQPTLIGDVNGDGTIDLTDAILIVYHSLGTTPQGFNALAADVNADGAIDLTDAILVIYKSLGAA